MRDEGRAFIENLLGLASPWSRAAICRLLTGRVHHVGAQTSLLPLLGNQVRGTSPPNLFPLDLDEKCHGFRPVVVAAEVELDGYREPGQLVIACKNNCACT